MHRFRTLAYLIGFVLVAVVVTGALPAKSAAENAAASLPRRGQLGAVVAADHGNVIVKSVIPGSAAEAAGLQAGDIVVSVDGRVVADVPDFLRKLRRPGGQPVELTLTRAGQTLHKTVILVEAPKEVDPQVITDYDAVLVDGTLRRTLISRPRSAPSGRLPAMLFIGGIGCYSIDLPLSAGDPYALLAHDLARHGIVTMRVEKSGIGDSQGPPCNSVDLVAESASYAAALQALRANPLVDPRKVYLFGHSIGTIIAPRLAAQQPVAGIIVAEAVAKNWFEYELINVQRQLQLGGEKPGAIDTAVAGKELCMHWLLIEGKTREAILKERPDCADHMQYPAPDSYLQEVAALNLAEAWTATTGPVLVIYGRADFETDAADHQRIADIVNASHPGTATYKIIDDMDHMLDVASSQQASYDADTSGKRLPYNAKLSEIVEQWLSAQTSNK